jgi:hypothetical protein
MQSQRAAEEKEIDVMDGDGGGDDQGGDEDSEDGDRDSKGGEGDSGDDDTTDAGGERTDGAKDDTTDAGEQTDGGSASAAKKKKSIRKDRDPPMLGTKREDFTQVNENGIPVEPKALAAGYGTQIGCIVRETMTINTRNLRDPGNAHLIQLLLQKLHERYDFPEEYKNLNLKDNKVNQQALTKISTALASWRTRVKKRIDKKESWEEIKKHEPLLEPDDYVLFKEELETDEKKKGRKHSRSKKASSQPSPRKILRAEDGVREEPRDFPMHIAGQPMLTKEMLTNAGGAIVNLHDSI